jgi:hypothetical protein
MNPFRDREPEKVAERYLEALKNGDYDAIAPLIDASYRDGFVQDEAEHPILAYRLGDRRGSGDMVEVMYEVERGNGGESDQVAFTLLKVDGEWTALSLTTVY